MADVGLKPVPNPEKILLRYTQHDRDSAGRLYVYPVLSRRAGGISLGINLNVNNACNWSCIYCQVEGLVKGGPDPIDMLRLGEEFQSLLSEILAGDVFVAEAAPEHRGLVDIAFSGNGEPTSAAEFPEVVELVFRLLDVGFPGHTLPVRVITNGSLMHRSAVQSAIEYLGLRGGEVWFKVDRLLPDSSLLVNGVPLLPEKVKQNLLLCAEQAPTWVQTCWLGIDGQSPSFADQEAYLDFLQVVKNRIQGVLLYGMARVPTGYQATRLSRLPSEEIECFAGLIRERTGLVVKASP
jgi:pyruvate-formate lyase-activating enzyme